MTTWRIRHQGSPRSIEGLSLPQVLDGLREGLWESTDETMGPDDKQWVVMESHPQLAEVAADLEPPPPKVHEDETRLDMNPLIDVALVLLIFFILTTSYAALHKAFEMPRATADQAKGPLKEISAADVSKVMIKVVATKDKESGKPVIRVEDQVVDEKELLETLRRYVKTTRKTELLIDAVGVEWGTVVMIKDAAAGAAIQRVYFLSPQPKR